MTTLAAYVSSLRRCAPVGEEALQAYNFVPVVSRSVTMSNIASHGWRHGTHAKGDPETIPGMHTYAWTQSGVDDDLVFASG